MDKRTIRIPVERSKNGRAFTLGISNTLLPYVKKLYDNCHPDSGLIFPGKKDPFKPMSFKTAWEYALTCAGINNYRFHDNRHTCGSYMAMAGYSLADIASLLNHKTLEMAKRYSHLADGYIARRNEKMNTIFLADVANNGLKYLK